MNDAVKSRRGVYYDLKHSPYEYTTPYGDVFKFSSKKKMEIYTRDIVKEVARVESLVDRHNMRGFIPDEIIQLLINAVYRAFYRKVEG